MDGTLAVVTEILHVFPQYLQGDGGVIPQLFHNRFQQNAM
jgi:hypothetical protein